MSPEAARAYQAGYRMAKSQAAYIARLYQDELLSMAFDILMCNSPMRGDFSEAARNKFAAMGQEGRRKSAAAESAGHIAGAIEGMRL